MGSHVCQTMVGSGTPYFHCVSGDTGVKEKEDAGRRAMDYVEYIRLKNR